MMPPTIQGPHLVSLFLHVLAWKCEKASTRRSFVRPPVFALKRRESKRRENHDSPHRHFQPRNQTGPRANIKITENKKDRYNEEN
jgi:hypothetical protein